MKQDILQAVKTVFPDIKISIKDINLEHPTVEAHGDYSTNIALKLAKEIGQKPQEIAQKIASKLKNASVAGPGFINITLDNDYLVEQVKKVIKEDGKYGMGDWGKGKTWSIEHTSPNPNKAMHLGHLRNNVTGMAIGNLWEWSGLKVIRDCIDNNRGIAIAKLMWGYLKFARKDGKQDKTEIDYWFDHQEEWQTPKDRKMRPDRFVDELYVKGATDYDDNKEVVPLIKKLVVDWENKDKKNWALWKKVLDYSYKGQNLTLKRLGNKWDKVWREHEHYEAGKDLVAQGLKKGIFKKSEGAIVTDLKKYNIPDTIVIKSDGTALYITQDLALTRLKKETFKSDRLFWVIGPEQSLALKQMFAVCEQLEIGKYTDFTHIAYGYMSLKGIGKMSSRKGNVVYIDDLIDMAKKKALEIMAASYRQKDLENKDDLAEKVAVGAIKYSILKVGRLQDTAFDMEESLSLEGDSGPYLQYTYARARSVLRKAKVKSLKLNLQDLTSEEMAILRWVYRFPEVVETAAKSFSPNLLCSYLFELAKRFNTFYANCPILENDFRLSLTQAVSIVLANGLAILGIEAVEKM